MLTPNGGVFGRNPKFNSVTVSGTLSSAGSAELMWYRAGVKTGQYTASVIVRLGTSPNGLVND